MSKGIPQAVSEYIENNAPQFRDMKPAIKRVSTGVAQYSKALNRDFAGIGVHVYSYTYVIKEPFRQILLITADSRGKILKVSHSK